MTESKIYLNNLKIVYPSLAKRAVFQDKVGKYEATFLLPKSDTELKAKLDKQINPFILQNNDNRQISDDRKFIRDGDFNKNSLFHNHWSIKASSNHEPKVLNQNKDFVATEQIEQLIYAGCFVNARINMWWQDHKEYGTRVNANLEVIQFYKHGEKIQSGVDDNFDDFEVVSIDDDTIPF